MAKIRSRSSLRSPESLGWVLKQLHMRETPVFSILSLVACIASSSALRSTSSWKYVSAELYSCPSGQVSFSYPYSSCSSNFTGLASCCPILWAFYLFKASQSMPSPTPSPISSGDSTWLGDCPRTAPTPSKSCLASSATTFCFLPFLPFFPRFFFFYWIKTGCSLSAATGASSRSAYTIGFYSLRSSFA